ncbi:hypothetical protein T636_A1825 [Enterobacter hormaechei subsp. xiangfangensis]|nr:hypothetical protein T636_A1825 [Enterobacter hormaechei subsp. xiangfangensis]
MNEAIEIHCGNTFKFAEINLIKYIIHFFQLHYLFNPSIFIAQSFENGNSYAMA